MHDLLLQNQQALQPEKLKAYARSLDLDITTFDNCLEKGKYTAEVQKDYEDGVTTGVQGTPTFFIGKTGLDNTIQGVLISGAVPSLSSARRSRASFERISGYPIVLQPYIPRLMRK